MNAYKIIGILIIVLGLLINELSIKIISSNEAGLFTTEKRLFLLFFQAVIISAGIYIIKKKKVAIQNLLLLFFSIIVFLLLLEFVLSFRMFQDLSSNNPVWIPAKYKHQNSELIKGHIESSSRNHYGFNDINHPFEKSHDIRIAILGDSFIWGYGVPDSVIWVNKLERLFQADKYDCKIMKWGKSGWSTADQFNFILEEGIKLEFDFLVFAFVVNDPDRGAVPLKTFIHTGGFVYRNIILPISCVFPNSVSFVSDLIENFMAKYFGYGYYNWLNNEVYTDDNLSMYSELLTRINEFCEKKNLKYVFILTPESHNPILERYFNIIEEAMKQNSIPYLNLFPFVKSELKNYSVRELWANPADGHPGDLVTQVFANHSYRYLLTRIF